MGTGIVMEAMGLVTIWGFKRLFGGRNSGVGH
jgi:hypothetical protein